MSLHPETSTLANPEPSQAGQRGSLSVTDLFGAALNAIKAWDVVTDTTRPNAFLRMKEAIEELRDAVDNTAQLRAALTAALPVLDEHAEDERKFWGAEDKHGLATEAEKIHEQAKAVLSSPNEKLSRPAAE